MKFRDGMWLVKEEFRVDYAEEVFSVTPKGTTSTGLSLLCPTKRILSRGDTLNCPTLTVDVDAVCDDVISVTTRHWKGAQNKGPFFDLFPHGKPELTNASITQSTKGTVLTAGSLQCTVSSEANTFDLRFESTSGQKVTSLSNRSVGYAWSPATASPKQLEDISNLKHYIFTQTTLGVGEKIFGLGERFTEFNKRGQSVTLYNEDGGTSSEQAYKNIPFYLSSAGYGVFIDHAESLDLEIGSERSCRLQVSAETQRLKWYIIYGPTPKDVLRKYALLTGFAPRLPSWSYGLWLSTSFTTDYDEKTVTSFLDGMHERNLPVSVFHFDCFWLRPFHWCDFIFSEKDFPNPKEMMTRIKKKYPNIKISAWINPYIGDASPVFEEAAGKGYLVKRENGDVWQWDLWQAGMGLVDFTNPAACRWFEMKLETLFDIGIDCLKTDFGERIPDKGVTWFDKSLDPKKMHNYYSFLYNKVVYAALERRFGPGEAVLFSRSATAGGQRFPVHWGGDCESTFEALAESLRGGLSLGLSGFPYWSCDIGGFEGTPNPTLYKRWLAFGLLISHSRLHGSNSYRVPWLIDDTATLVLQDLINLKMRILPYLYTQAHISTTQTGLPLLRAMFVEFPEDPTVWTLDTQYMLGDSLLVAPVLSEDGRVTFYLPAGRWTNYFSDEVVVGPQWRTEIYPNDAEDGFSTLPLYVRENTVLVVNTEEGIAKTSWTKNDEFEVWAYQVTGSKAASWVDSDGGHVGTVTVAFSKESSETVIKMDPPRTDFKLRVDGDYLGSD